MASDTGSSSRLIVRAATAALLSFALLLPANAQFWGNSWGGRQQQPQQPYNPYAQQPYNPYGGFGGDRQWGYGVLEPTDRRMIDGVGKRNLAQRLAGCHTLQGFARLMLGQLRLPAKSYAFGHGASAAFVSPLQDQAALKFSNAGKHGQHQAAMCTRGVGPRIAERLEASAFLADQVDDPE